MGVLGMLIVVGGILDALITFNVAAWNQAWPDQTLGLIVSAATAIVVGGIMMWAAEDHVEF